MQYGVGTVAMIPCVLLSSHQVFPNCTDPVWDAQPFFFGVLNRTSIVRLEVFTYTPAAFTRL